MGTALFLANLPKRNMPLFGSLGTAAPPPPPLLPSGPTNSLVSLPGSPFRIGSRQVLVKCTRTCLRILPVVPAERERGWPARPRGLAWPEWPQKRNTLCRVSRRLRSRRTVQLKPTTLVLLKPDNLASQSGQPDPPDPGTAALALARLGHSLPLPYVGRTAPLPTQRRRRLRRRRSVTDRASQPSPAHPHPSLARASSPPILSQGRLRARSHCTQNPA